MKTALRQSHLEIPIALEYERPAKVIEVKGQEYNMDSGISAPPLRTGFAKLFRIWMVFVGTLLLLAPTDMPLLNRVLGVIILILSFGIVLSRAVHHPSRQSKFPRAVRISEQRQLFLLLVQIALMSIAVAFYTGTNLASGLFDSLRGLNTYGAYQEFFRDRGIGATPVFSRIHIILSMAIGKLIFFVLVANFFLTTARRTFVSSSIFACSVLTYASFGMSRGTFFEVFEIFVAIGYFSYISRKPRNVRGKSLFNKPMKIALVAALPILFIINTMRRYGDSLDYFEHLCSSNFCFMPYGIDRNLEYFSYIFATYFSNGPYALSVYFEQVLQGKHLEYLLPMWGYSVTDFELPGVKGLMCEHYLNCRFVWMPDLFIFLAAFGIFSFIFSNVFLYWAIKNESRMIGSRRLVGHAFNFYVFLFVLSLPVGNFLTVSSSNIVGLVTAAVLMKFRFRLTGSNRRGARLSV